MENELDLTLRLGLPCPTVDTHLSLDTPTTYQGINVDGNRRDNNDDGEIRGRRQILWSDDESIDDDEGARNNVDVNIRYYNLIFNYFAGIGETLNFAPFPMQPTPYSSPAPALETPTGSDYVLIDAPARRAPSNYLAIENVLDADGNLKRRCVCGDCCAGRINGTWNYTNMNCNAINTPMWRRGPLSPKTLCNACGIKFRTEEEKRFKRNA